MMISIFSWIKVCWWQMLFNVQWIHFRICFGKKRNISVQQNSFYISLQTDVKIIKSFHFLALCISGRIDFILKNDPALWHTCTKNEKDKRSRYLSKIFWSSSWRLFQNRFLVKIFTVGCLAGWRDQGQFHFQPTGT